MKTMDVFKKRLDYVFITDRRRVLMQQAIISFFGCQSVTIVVIFSSCQ